MIKNLNKIMILQTDLVDIRFRGSELLPLNYKPNLENYRICYIEDYNKTKNNYKNLDDIFYNYNFDLPKDYKCRSLSVSDLIILFSDNNYEVYFVDTFGFKKFDYERKEINKLIERNTKGENKNNNE